MNSSALDTYVVYDDFTKPYLTSLGISPIFAKQPGSRQRYWHFMLGYVLPLVYFQEKLQLESFHVLDCGPLMNPILHRILNAMNYSFSFVAIDKITNPIVVQPWDHPYYNVDRKVIKKVCAMIATNLRISLSRSVSIDDPCTNLLVLRSAPSQFYLSNAEDGGGYGTSTRNISNLDDIKSFLNSRNVCYCPYEPGANIIDSQVSMFSNVRKFVGIRGSEWVNLIWANQDSKGLIFCKAKAGIFLENLTKKLGLDVRFEVMSESSSCDPFLIHDFFKS